MARRHTRLWIPLVVAAGAAAYAGHAATEAPRPSAAILADDSDGRDWPGYGRTFGEQHFSPLAQVNAGNVGQLGLAWSMDLDQSGNSATAPIAVGGVLYFASGYSVVHAVEATTGKLLWTYDPEAAEAAGRKLRQGWGSRGLAWWNGKIYVGTHDGRLIALDAATGKPVWTQMTVDKDDSRYITGAPRVFDGKVIIGHGGGDVGSVRGYVTTYDAETGRQLWRFYTVPGDPKLGFENEAMKMAAKTWFGEWWKLGGGGTVWNAITYDPETDTVFLGVGNGSPWNQKARSEGKGDNLFLCSMVAVDAKTGAYKWHYQMNPGDSWDYNAAMDMEIADLRIGARLRKVIMTAPKNGFYYVIDRTDGKLISAEPYVTVNWASRIDLKTGRPVENPQARYPNGSTFRMWPSPIGAHSWMPMAYSPATRLTYLPSVNKSATWTDALDGGKWLAETPAMAPRSAAAVNIFPAPEDKEDGTSALIAWDPATQKSAWKVPTPGFSNGGVMATGGNLVFQGHVDGTFNAYAADSGKPLWTYAAQAGIIAPPITYEAGGRQYVTVLTGIGTSVAMLGPLLQRFHIDQRTQARRVLTFVLGGKAVLPATTPMPPLAAAADADYRPDEASAGRGARTFGMLCSTCHGGDAVAAGQGPDLRASGVPLSAEAFETVVRQGALVAQGMPRFDEFTDQQIADVRQYIRARAAALRTVAGK